MKIRRLCLFAHYDAQNEVKPYIVAYLAELKKHCQEVTFITVSQLPNTEQRKVAKLASQVLSFENRGFDFSMWQHALDSVDLANFDELLLTNSSVFGPIFPLSEVFELMHSMPLDIWGLTDNTEYHWHLQSYFLLFRRSVFLRPEFGQFWRSILPFEDKLQTILSYELGLSAFFRQHGFALGAYAPVHGFQFGSANKGKRQLRYDKSPPIAYPEKLIVLRVPLLKIELFRDNPYDIDLRSLRRLIAATGFDINSLSFDRDRGPKAVRWNKDMQKIGSSGAMARS